MSPSSANAPRGLLDRAQFESLRRLDACTLANAIETFNVRLRNEGFVDSSVRSLTPYLPPMLGYAATVTIRGSAPPTADSRFPDRTDWWDYIRSVPEPRVVVIRDGSSHAGFGALVGIVHMSILRALGCVGVVTNGAVRDLPAASAAGFHYFAANLAVSHAYVHIVEFGQPVEIGGLAVASGDLLHGDLHGVQNVPSAIASRIPAVAAEISARKQALIALTRAPDFSLQKLREAVAHDLPFGS